MRLRNQSPIASRQPNPSEREMQKQLNRANRKLATIERRKREARDFRPVARLLNELVKIGERHFGEE